MMRFPLSWRGGPAIFIVLGGIFVLLSILLLVIFTNTISQLQKYRAGDCTITAKQLLQQEQQETHMSNGHTYTTTTIVYEPDFQFTVSSNQSSQQAIVDQYTVGKTYPCWYNPANPTQAVLTRQFNWLIFIIPGLFLFVGAWFVIVGVVLIRNRL